MATADIADEKRRKKETTKTRPAKTKDIFDNLITSPLWLFVFVGVSLVDLSIPKLVLSHSSSTRFRDQRQRHFSFAVVVEIITLFVYIHR